MQQVRLIGRARSVIKLRNCLGRNARSAAICLRVIAILNHYLKECCLDATFFLQPYLFIVRLSEKRIYSVINIVFKLTFILRYLDNDCI